MARVVDFGELFWLKLFDIFCIFLQNVGKSEKVLLIRCSILGTTITPNIPKITKKHPKITFRYFFKNKLILCR